MSRQSLKLRLATFLRKYYSESFIASGDLQRKVAETTNYTPQNVGRRLRELENEGVIDVKYVRGHAHYRARLAHSTEALAAASVRWYDQLPEQQQNQQFHKSQGSPGQASSPNIAA